MSYWFTNAWIEECVLQVCPTVFAYVYTLMSVNVFVNVQYFEICLYITGGIIYCQGVVVIMNSYLK